MEVYKKINNNVALARDAKGRELVVFGKGIGFASMPYELTDLSRIQRTFYDVNEKYFAGYFPDTPIMPGVLLIESAAQLCSLVFAPESVEEDKLYVLLKVKDFKMLRPVIPGDTLIISVNVTMSTKSAFEFACVIKVDGEVRAKGNLLFTTMDKNAVYKPSQE